VLVLLCLLLVQLSAPLPCEWADTSLPGDLKLKGFAYQMVLLASCLK